jgi:VanZ family protein
VNQPSGTATRFASRWWPVIGWAAVILTATSWPKPPQVGPDVPGADKVLHFGVYAILGYLVAKALRPPRGWSARLNAITAMVIFAFADELHQSLIPGRSTELLDWVADTTGATIGLATGLILLTLARMRQDHTT